MTKKDFKASLGPSIKAQDTAIKGKDKFDTVDEVVPGLTASLEKPPATTKPEKSRTLVVRHTFSMSESDYTTLDTLRRAAEAKGMRLSASDICRIAIHAIRDYSAEEVIAAVDKLERLRPGKRS